MLRVIREVQPRFIVGENVPGLINWSGGVVFEEVQSDLEAAGYEVLSYVLPACGVDAPHRRERVWVIAYDPNAYDNRKSGKGRGNEGESGNERLQKRNEIQQLEKPDSLRPTNTKALTDTDSGKRCEGRMHQDRPKETERYLGTFDTWKNRGNWENFPTQSPIRERDDGVSDKLLIFVVNDLYNEISKTSKENRVENLSEVWSRVQQEEVWQKIRRLYSLESKDILFKTMQLYSTKGRTQIELSPFGEDFCKPILQHLRKHKEFRCSPQGQELEKQRTREFGNSLSFLPHEVALAARRFETAITKFENWHRNESIKAYGNALVPQVALQIFKAIDEYSQITA